MSSLFGIQIPTLISFIISLAFVLMLLYAVLYLARHFGLLQSTTPRVGRSKMNRLSISEVMVIDGRRKMLLVKRDDVEHLILIGGPQDVCIEVAINNSDISETKSIARDVLNSKNSTTQSELQTSEIIEDNYKISSWTIPVVQGATPQVVVSPVTKAEIDETASSKPNHMALRRSVEGRKKADVEAITTTELPELVLEEADEITPNKPSKKDPLEEFFSTINAPEDTKQQPLKSIEKAVDKKAEKTANSAIEKAKEAVLFAVNSAKQNSVSTIQNLKANNPKLNTVKVEEESVELIVKDNANAQPINLTEAIKAAMMQDPESTKDSSEAKTLTTQTSFSSLSVDDDMEEQLQALSATPILKGAKDENPVLSTFPDQIANTNEPANAPTHSSKIENAFSFIFGLNKQDDKLEIVENAEIQEQFEQQKAYAAIFENKKLEDSDDAKPASKKQTAAQKTVAKQPQMAYAGANSKAASFDELEQELAKILMEPKK